MKKLVVFTLLLGLGGCVSKKTFVALASEHQKEKATTDSLRLALDAQKAANISQKDSFDLAYTALLAQLDGTKKDLQQTNDALLARAAMLRNIQEETFRRFQLYKWLETQLQEALLPFDWAVNFQKSEKQLVLSFPDSLFFLKASTDLTPTGKEVLKTLAPFVGKHQLHVEIRVFTAAGTIATARFRDNWDFSVLRATSVSRWWTEKNDISGNWVLASGNGPFKVPLEIEGQDYGRVVLIFQQMEPTWKVLEMLEEVGDTL